MKKIILLLAFFSATSLALAESEYCAQVIQPAVNKITGECKEFATPCEVPDQWIKVSSCRAAKTMMAQKRRTNSSFDRRLNRSHWNKARSQSQKTSRSTGNRRFGAGSYTRSTKPKSITKRAQTIKKTGATKNTFNKRRYNRSSINPSRISSNKLTDQEKYQQKLSKWKQWGQRRPAIRSSARQSGRKGSTAQTQWTRDTKNRFRERNIGGASPYWKSPNQRRIKKKKKFTPRTFTNKRGWKGKRLEGTLDGTLTD